MAKVKLEAGATIDTLTRDELDSSLKLAIAEERERLRGRKHIRFRSASASPSGSNLTLGGYDHNQGIILGPTQGFTWSVRLFVIIGLTASSSAPDVMNVIRSGTSDIIWQLNGNTFAQTWGLGEVTLRGGESLQIQNVGALTTTTNIYFHGEADEIPAERAGAIW